MNKAGLLNYPYTRSISVRPFDLVNKTFLTFYIFFIPWTAPPPDDTFNEEYNINDGVSEAGNDFQYFPCGGIII